MALLRKIICLESLVALLCGLWVTSLMAAEKTTNFCNQIKILCEKAIKTKDPLEKEEAMGAVTMFLETHDLSVSEETRAEEIICIIKSTLPLWDAEDLLVEVYASAFEMNPEAFNTAIDQAKLSPKRKKNIVDEVHEEEKTRAKMEKEEMENEIIDKKKPGKKIERESR